MWTDKLYQGCFLVLSSSYVTLVKLDGFTIKLILNEKLFFYLQCGPEKKHGAFIKHKFASRRLKNERLHKVFFYLKRGHLSKFLWFEAVWRKIMSNTQKSLSKIRFWKNHANKIFELDIRNPKFGNFILLEWERSKSSWLQSFPLRKEFTFKKQIYLPVYLLLV